MALANGVISQAFKPECPCGAPTTELDARPDAKFNAKCLNGHKAHFDWPDDPDRHLKWPDLPAAPAPAKPKAPPPPPATLAEVLHTFRRWLHLPDDGLILAVLGVVAANLMDGDPVWLMIVGGSGRGKTEILNSLSRLPDVHVAATITESALLSGTPKRDKAAGAKGGLLPQIGEFGFLVLKDFTSILSMHRDARSAVLAALREIYDGSWTRRIGAEGGRELSWAGKLAVLAGCTTTIDAHHAVIGTMGERFFNYRIPAAGDQALARQALRHQGQEKRMRAELADVVAGLFTTLDFTGAVPELSEAETDRLVNLAELAARCRSPIERDGRSREIELIPDPEAPTRLALSLSRLYCGIRAIGVESHIAWQTVIKVGLDCMPAIRRAVLDQLLAYAAPALTSEIATAIDYPTGTARRTLEDLAAHGIVSRTSAGTGNADVWEATPFTISRYEAVNRTLPEMSEDVCTTDTLPPPLINSQILEEDFSGKVPPDIDPAVAAAVARWLS